MRVEECRGGASDEPRWDEFVSHGPDTGHFHRYGWARVVHRSYGHTPIYLWARDERRIRGILPLVLFRGALVRRSLVSLPFMDEAGLCADGHDAAQALWQAALEVARRERVSSLELRQRVPSGLGLDSVGSKVTMMLELAADGDAMWKKLDAKVRNQVRKATSSGLAAAWCGVEGLEDFYEVFAQNMRDLGSPVHGRRFFQTLLEEFADSTRLLLVRDGSRTVAAGVCAVFRDTVLVPWASSLREWRSRSPSNLLYWEVIRSACEKGLRWLDFGRSSPGSGTYHFKKQWGSIERPLHWERFSSSSRSGRTSMVHADDPRYGWMVRVWQRLPVSIATSIGPTLRGRISN